MFRDLAIELDGEMKIYQRSNNVAALRKVYIFERRQESSRGGINLLGAIAAVLRTVCTRWLLPSINQQKKRPRISLPQPVPKLHPGRRQP